MTNEIDKDATPRQYVSKHSDTSRLTLWAAIRRCSRWALPAGICFSVIATFAVMKSMVPRYRAVCLLEANGDYLQFGDADPVVQDLASAEKLLLFHPVVLNAVLEDGSLRGAPSLSDPDSAAARLRENLAVDSGGSLTRMVVSYEDTDRSAAAMVCNAVVSRYLQKLDGFDANAGSNLERWLAPEIARWEHEVEQKQQMVVKLARHTAGQRQYGEERRHFEQSASDSAQLKFVADDLSVANDVLVKLRERVAAIRTERSKGGRVRVLAPAVPPNDSVQSLPIKRMATVSIASFLLPFLIGCLWQFGGRDRGNSSAAEDVNE